MKHIAILAASAVLAGTLGAQAQDFTAAGTELRIGDSATVPHLVVDGPQVPIELTITAIEEGSLDDLANFQIPEQLRDTRPYYVRYSYTNLSDEDLGHNRIGSFVGTDDRGTDFMPSAAIGAPNNPFEKCLNRPPVELTRDQSAEGCLLFMIHKDGSLTSVAYQGGYRHVSGQDTRADYPIYYDPIRWVPGDDADEGGAAADGAAGTVIGG